MGTRTLDRRPLGALGRMGLVAAMHVGVVYLIADSLGMVPPIASVVPISTRIIDEPPPNDPAPAPRVIDVAPSRPTVILPDQQLPPIEFEMQETITGPPVFDETG